jgi:hypothetical protein
MSRLGKICVVALFVLGFLLGTGGQAVGQGVLWAKRLEYHGNSDDGRGMALDAAGNVFVAGTSTVPGNSDFAPRPSALLLSKYLPDGSRQWIREFSDVPNRFYSAMAIDPSGNLVVASDGDFDFWDVDANEHFYNPGLAVSKYDTDGHRLWTRRYNDADPEFDDEPTSIAIDASGAIYLAGTSSSYWNWVEECDCRVIKYAPDGTRLWVRKTGLGIDLRSRPKVAVDSHGNAYVTTRRWTSGGGDMVTLKYNPNGFLLWDRTYATSIRSDDDGGHEIALDSQGNVVTAAPYGVTGEACHILILKYRPNGALAWARKFDRANESDTRCHLALDGSDNVLVGMSAYHNATRDDYLVAKYLSNGALMWTRQYDGSLHGYDQISDIAVDEQGSVYATGASYGQPNGPDMATVKWDSLGTRIWVRTYNGDRTNHLGDWGMAVAVAPDGNVLVHGTSILASIDIAPDADFYTIKYQASK